jgi:hypothetical protein
MSTMLPSKITGNQNVWNEVFSGGIIFITRFLKTGQQVLKRTVQWGRSQRDIYTKHSVLKTLCFSVLGRELSNSMEHSPS